MCHTPFASIIMPVFNAEKWLKSSIGSVMKQTCDDLELILINDGSSDNSGKICDEYAKLHKNISVVHKENAGVSAARNNGMELAKGEFIIFVDADDIVHPQTVELLKTACGMHETDYYFWKLTQFKEEIEFAVYRDLHMTQMSGEEILWDVLDAKGDIRGYACNKAFRRSKIRGVCFDEDISVREDALFICSCILNDLDSVRGCLLDAELYGYRQHPESALHQAYSYKSITSIIAQDKVYDMLVKAPVNERKKKEQAQIIKQNICFHNAKCLLSKTKKRFSLGLMLDEFWKKYRKYPDCMPWTGKYRKYRFVQRCCMLIRTPVRMFRKRKQARCEK